MTTLTLRNQLKKVMLFTFICMVVAVPCTILICRYIFVIMHRQTIRGVPFIQQIRVLSLKIFFYSFIRVEIDAPRLYVASEAVRGAADLAPVKKFKCKDSVHSCEWHEIEYDVSSAGDFFLLLLSTNCVLATFSRIIRKRRLWLTFQWAMPVWVASSLWSPLLWAGPHAFTSFGRYFINIPHLRRNWNEPNEWHPHRSWMRITDSPRLKW